MENIQNKELLVLIDKAVAGDKDSLETVILSVQDLVFNLSLRMLGTFPDAEDASQDILLKIITHLSSFKRDSSFSTWVFSIAVNHLKNYKKHMFAKFPLSFEFYGDDIANGKTEDVPDLTQDVEKALFGGGIENVFHQRPAPVPGYGKPAFSSWVPCSQWTAESRGYFGYHTETYRQRLSRIRKKMADFLGETGNTGAENAIASTGQLRDTESSDFSCPVGLYLPPHQYPWKPWWR